MGLSEKRLLKLIIFGFVVYSSSIYAAEREKVGLVLSGGGARGIAHIGVLKELERQHIPIDYVTGTSMGAIVGGLYASGRSVNEIEQILQDIDWADIFSDTPPRTDASLRRKFDDDIFQVNKELGLKDGKVQIPSGLMRGQKLQLLLDKLFLHVNHLENFDQFPIPFRAVATDIATGEAIVLSEGSLATAIRASMSVPSIFTTVKHQEHILVDGGLSNNLPVDIAREMGASTIIAVDVGSTLLKEEQLDSVLGVGLQMTTLMVRNTTQAQIKTLTEDDILIVPDLSDFSSSDFELAVETIDSGIEATLAASEQLAQLSVTQNDMQLLSQNRQPVAPPSLITFIRINNNSNYNDNYLLDRISQPINANLNFDQLEKDIGEIYGLGTFESVTYDIVREDQGSGLILNITEKPWGPRYLQFGLRYESEVGNNNQLSGVIGYTVTPINALNGEWRTILRFGEEPGLATEFHQPLARNSSFFLNANLVYIEQQINTFEDGLKINQTQSKKFGTTVSLGKEFDNWGDLRFGINRFRAANSTEFGVPAQFNSTGTFDGGELFVLGRVDTLDNNYFPKKGLRGSVKFSQARDAYGSDFEFEQIQFDALHASTWGKREHTLLLGLRYFSTVEGTVPVQSRFRLGGLFTLPGFVTNELSGEHLYLIRSAYQRQLDGLFGSPYLGLTLQYGNVFQDRGDISLSEGIGAAAAWLGWNSIAGPVYIGYGRAEAGDSSIYLSVGGFF